MTTLVNGARKELLDLIKRRGEVSVDDATTELSLAKTTVRQHLLRLEHQRLITRVVRKTGVGRPQLVYRVSIEGQVLFPNREPALLRELLKYLVENGRKDAVEAFFMDYWGKRRELFVAALGEVEAEGECRRGSTDARLEALRRLLESEGFMPEIERGKGTKFSLRECNCPFPEVMQVTRLPCQLESDFIRWALKVATQRRADIPGGASSCEYFHGPVFLA